MGLVFSSLEIGKKSRLTTKQEKMVRSYKNCKVLGQTLPELLLVLNSKVPIFVSKSNWRNCGLSVGLCTFDIEVKEKLNFLPFLWILILKVSCLRKRGET